MKAAALAKRVRFSWVQSVAVALANRFARPKNMTVAPVCVYDGPPTCGKLRALTTELPVINGSTEEISTPRHVRVLNKL